MPSHEVRNRIPRELLRYGSILTMVLWCCHGLAAPPQTTSQAGGIATGEGWSRHPVRLERPATSPLGPVAELGRKIFHDRSMSASGRLSCASCHDPARAYGPPDVLPVVTRRPAPSLMYRYRQPNFSIGPDDPESEGVDIGQAANNAVGFARAKKGAVAPEAAPAMVPQGGLFWDGRVNTLQDQALGPLLNPAEMGNSSADAIAEKLRRPRYLDDFVRLFGAHIADNPRLLVAEALFAIGRYQVEDSSFHPYSSKFDYWLEGRVPFTAAELRGYALFDQKEKGNCAACHRDKPGLDGQAPMFTDYQYEALGVPRNDHLPANRNPRFFDLGLCGPDREDLRTQNQYCGMFITPSLRNAATRRQFFHNGVFHSLAQVLAFYNLRDVRPEEVYPLGPDGRALRFNDLPGRYRLNVDVIDPPFDRKRGDPAHLTQRELADIVSFLGTLSDGYPIAEFRAMAAGVNPHARH